MEILIGTKNQYKAGEMIAFLGNFPQVQVHPWEDLNLVIKVEEDQSTLQGNAVKKALEISQHTNWYVLTSDGGVDIPGLGEKWDILRNQRIIGENLSDLEKAEKLLILMQNLQGENRKAAYHLALALAWKGSLIWSTEQISDLGYIAEKLPTKEIPPYKWMGHIWFYPKHGKVFNQLSEKEKDDVRKVGIGIKRSLRRKVREVIKTEV